MKALAWACPMAMTYTYDKKIQLSCIQRRCIDLAVEGGIPITTCSRLHEAQKCLYIESALGEMLGGAGVAGAIFAQMAYLLLYQLRALAIIAFAYKIPCYPYYNPATSGDHCKHHVTYGGPLSGYCGLFGAGLSIKEFVNMFKDKEAISDTFNTYKNYIHNPSETNYCSEYGY